MKLAILGAGMAGLAAAHRLRQVRPELEIELVEKSRGVGGRAATRRAHGAVFDHGAQYIKGGTPEVDQLLREALPHATLADIEAPVWTFDGAGTLAPGDREQNAAPKWSYAEGITQLAKALLGDTPVRREARVHRLRAAGAGYELLDEQGTVIAAAAAVLLTPPAPQTAAILAASDLEAGATARLTAELDKAAYRPCLTITLGYAPTLRDRPWYALVNTDRQHPVSWLAYEHRKPGRESGGQHVVIAQMAPGWSRDHWETPAPDVAKAVAALVSDLLDEDLGQPRWSDRQGWRYALPDGGADFDALNGALPGLFFAGDFTAGQGRVHKAIEEGWRAADRIAAWAAQGAAR